MRRLSPAREKDLLGMGRRATAAYVLLVVPASAVIMAFGIGFPLGARAADPTPATWLAVASFATMIVLVGLSLLIPGTVSWWWRVRACRAFARDRVAGREGVEAAERVSLRFVGTAGPIGLERGPGVPDVAARVNGVLVWMWIIGVAIAVTGLVVSWGL